MARSLNKKYFGNRNVGTSADTDTGIGGEGVASVTITAAGTYTAQLPTATFSAPDLPTGVTATGIVHGKGISAAIGTRGTGYNVGDIVVQANGATGTYSTWKVRSVRVASYTIDTTGQGNFDGDERLALDSTIDAKWTTAFVVDVNGGGAGNSYRISSSALQQAGIWNGGTDYTPAPTHVAIDGGGQGHVTRGAASSPNYGATSDANGSGGFLNIVYGIETLDLVSEGDLTAITSGAKNLNSSTGSGSGATATITYGVKSIAITEKGSGYTSASDAAVTFTTNNGTTSTVVLTSDSGVLSPSNNSQGQNAGDNQENAIVPYAKTTALGTSKPADIIRQVGARRFKVKTADGTAICELKGSAVSAEGEMTITATDSAGGTYFVTKMGGRKATVTRGTGTQFATDSAVQWTFDAPTASTTVKINNA